MANQDLARGKPLLQLDHIEFTSNGILAAVSQFLVGSEIGVKFLRWKPSLAPLRKFDLGARRPELNNASAQNRRGLGI
jgi:hypothetical protein